MFPAAWHSPANPGQIKPAELFFLRHLLAISRVGGLCGNHNTIRKGIKGFNLGLRIPCLILLHFFKKKYGLKWTGKWPFLGTGREVWKNQIFLDGTLFGIHLMLKAFCFVLMCFEIYIFGPVHTNGPQMAEKRR